MIATCHTQGCENRNVPIDVGDLAQLDPDTGQPVLDADGQPLIMDVMCGPCGHPITDVSDEAPASTADSTERQTP